MNKAFMRNSFVTLFLFLFSAAANAALLVPAGLAPGDTYQLVFVTSGTTAATSADIAYYNSFVQSAADAAGIGSSAGISWTAIASTATADANTNAVVSGPVFNMNGDLVASSYTDFWDGTHTLGVGIDFDQNGNSRNYNVWTGSNTNGTGYSGATLGSASVRWGESTFSSAGWISHGTTSATTLYSIYTLSEVLTAPVPVPAALWLFGSGLLGLIAAAKRKQTVS